MKELGESRARQLREQSGFAQRRSLRSRRASAAPTSSTCCTTSPSPETYGGLPSNPRVPWTVWLWKRPLKWLGNLAMVGGLIGVFVHYLRFGPKTIEEDHDVPNPGEKP